uniref:PCI domain-containing protein n=1 Tax=Parastrongyloides trichosuri TaxID=131310 RepID=A0A0N4Z499_PARTI
MSENRQLENSYLQLNDQSGMDSTEIAPEYIPDPVSVVPAEIPSILKKPDINEQPKEIKEEEKIIEHKELHKIDDCTIDYEDFANNFDIYITYERIKHIIEICPSKKEEGYTFLYHQLKEKTKNLAVCLNVYQKLSEINPNIPKMDTSWQQILNNNIKATQYQLKANHKSAMETGSKVLLRNQLLEQVEFCIEVGDFIGANKILASISTDYAIEEIDQLKLFSKIISVTFYQEFYERLDAILQQLKRQLTVYDTHKALSGDNRPRSVNVIALKKESDDYDEIKNTFSIYSGFYAFFKRQYNNAAKHFKDVNLDILKTPYILSPKDICRYSALSALACDVNQQFNDDDLDREEIDREINMKNKHPFASNPAFRKLINRDEKIQRIFDSFYKNDFEETFHLINGMKDEFLMDKFINVQYDHLIKEITKNAVLRYMKPLANGSIDTMGRALCIEKPYLLNIIEELVFSGKLECKLDVVTNTFVNVIRNCKEDFFNDLLLSQKYLMAKSKISIIQSICLRSNIIHGTSQKLDDGRSQQDRRFDVSKFSSALHGYIIEGSGRRKTAIRHVKSKKKVPSTSKAVPMDVDG